MNLLGITMAYNEEDCIANAIRVLLSSGHEVHVFDHGSTDRTEKICLEYVRHGVFYHYLSRTLFPATVDGMRSSSLWLYLAKFARSMCGQFDWVTWLAADEILRQPNGAILTSQSIGRMVSAGVQVIRPLIRDFWMTTSDPEEEDYLKRLRYYRVNSRGHSPRGWQIGLTPKKMPHGLHIQDRRSGNKLNRFYGLWPSGTRVSNNRWLLDHYPLRTKEQAIRKITRERDWMNASGVRRYQSLRRKGASGIVRNSNVLSHESRCLDMPAEPCHA